MLYQKLYHAKRKNINILFDFCSTLYSQSIRINEISASNTIFFDEDGDTPDWIEIYNYGEQNISLHDWSISDSENDNTP